jgi:hypothetical protein
MGLFGRPGQGPGGRAFGLFFLLFAAARVAEFGVFGWQEAFEAEMAPKVNLRATHVLTLEFVNLADLEKFAL